MVLDGVLVEPEITWLGLARDKVATFTVPGTPPPGAFTLTAPASGATNQPSSVTLSWGTSVGAASYAYCLDTTLNGACNGTWPSVGAATSATVSGLTGGATYEWQVRATNATGTTDATGAWRTFTVAAAAPLVKTSPASGTTGLGSPVILTWASTLTNVAYTVCWDQTPDGACSGVWWPNGQSLVKWLENLAPGTYYWQVRAQTPTGYVYADGEPTYWAFTVGSDPMAEAGASGPSAGDGLMRRPSDEPSAWPIGAPLAIALLTLVGVLGLRRSRPRRVRQWAVPAWLSLLALLWPAGVAAQGGERVEYYHLDALGSVRVVTDASGQVVRRHDFGPFGEEVAPTHPNPERKLFTGHERDAETALDYFGARYYRADVGRFTTVDPAQTISENLVDPQRWNRYAYVTNNPLKFTDPDGKNPLLIAGGIGAAVYGGFAIYQNVSHGLPWYNNVGVEATKGLLVGATLGLAAPAVAAGEAALAAGGTASLWGLAPAARGLAVEAMEGGNLGNFPVIDKFANGVATSIKSLDLGAASYQSGGALLSRVTGYVDKLASFNGASYGGFTVAAQDIASRVLLLVVPPGASAAQAKALQAAIEYGRSVGVTVMTKVAQ